MIDKSRIDEIVSSYKKPPAVATICSHSSLQIFHGARQEGLKTIGICIRGKEKIYDAFPLAKPDEFIFVNSYSDIPVSELVSRNAILVPHGSFVEYMGEKVDDLAVPILGNRNSLVWERSREKMFDWMHKAGLKTPKVFLSPSQIDRPAIVKFQGAKGGQGYVVVNSPEEYRQKVGDKKAMVQEFMTGVRAYPHYFYSPLNKKGYPALEGSVELLGVDRRIESNADEIGRALHAGAHSRMSFTVVANEPMVLRESLLPEYMEIGKKTAEAADKLFGGIPGPYCVETIITEDLQIYAFEISARIVAGTNIFADSSPYSVFMDEQPMSMGRRIAMEMKSAAKAKRLAEICY
ncbi:5-formaminoimidazole-4-carboxamide-1-(beta)-D-ribofuranosyl 5'-monophosphate synthetase [uncultured archaeon]|nr:5-formaminoimidazole-4-carboxamide-1-(beta)-D-ribofuranosyl 5'-monophosphate synthetase [uncultured archaeon]